jgi:hypothetical protein
MGYKDPEKRKAYHREYQRVKRQKETQDKTPVKLFQETHSDFRVRTARDVLGLVEQTINKVVSLESDNMNETLAQAKAIGYLAGIALKAVETADIEDRVIALEDILKMRGAA